MAFVTFVPNMFVINVLSLGAPWLTSPWKLSATREDVMLLTRFIWRIFGFGKTVEKNQLTSGNVLLLMTAE